MTFNCSLCDYQTLFPSNYKKHLQTQKHQKNEEKSIKNEEKSIKSDETNTTSINQYVCQWCRREFKRSDNLQRHLSSCIQKFNIDLPNLTCNNLLFNKDHYCKICNKEFCNKYVLQRHIKMCFNKNVTNVNKQEEKCIKIKVSEPNKKSPEMSPKSPYSINDNKYKCNYCSNYYSYRKGLLRHQKMCLNKKNVEYQQNLELEIQKLKNEQFEMIIEQKEQLLKEKDKIIAEKDLRLNDKQQTIEIAKNSKNITINNTNSKTINFLNSQYSDMIAMEQFLKALEHTHQLTIDERKTLLMAYRDCGIDVFARNFSYIMKQNCKRQLEAQGLEDMKLLPLFCSDGNLRSHKEKQLNGWKTQYDNQSINQMINISNQQIHESYHQLVPISGKERTRVYKEIKRDNHQNKLLKSI